MMLMALIVLGGILYAIFRGNAREALAQSKNLLEAFEKNQERLERLLREEGTHNRLELTKSLESFSKQIFLLTEINEKKLEKIRDVLEERLNSLQEDNSRKLERMRETVDEKLQSTLERRLGESFRTVSERLEKVHQGLGEMQSLAAGVGDLKKVLTNVKARGTWGEIQLGNLLEQILSPQQYKRNVITKKETNDPVDFVIILPGREGRVVFIPIDAKFPKEDYERLISAQEEANSVLLEESAKAIENRIKLEAKKIRDKYIDPPNTTDFGILYLPIEGLYAEVLRRSGLCEFLQREYRVTVAGPTTIAAFLNSLQMGFRTLAVERRASDVWRLLDEVKKEFGKFGDILEKTQNKLRQASDEIESAARKSRTIERRLRGVQELPAPGEDALEKDQAIDVAPESFDEKSLV